MSGRPDFRKLRPLHTDRDGPRLTGTVRVEGPGDPPVCPGCGAVGRYFSCPIGADLIGWCWSTVHESGCPWMADPNAEPYG